MRFRTFIAVELEQFTRDRLRGLQEQLSSAAEGVKWVEPENLHLTLIFLGEVDERQLPKVCSAVADASAPLEPFAFTLAGLGAFPMPRRPRTLIAKVSEGAEQLIALHAAIEAPLLDLGCYRREGRPFSPHVTFGRVKREGGSDNLAAALLKYGAWQGGQTHVREVRVLASELRPDGPEYTVLGRGRLGGRS
jgi:RNA 2',3'-cyclic 3'-phosphodiesterase